jgi:hypothetical protein
MGYRGKDIDAVIACLHIPGFGHTFGAANGEDVGIDQLPRFHFRFGAGDETEHVGIMHRQDMAAAKTLDLVFFQYERLQPTADEGHPCRPFDVAAFLQMMNLVCIPGGHQVDRLARAQCAGFWAWFDIARLTQFHRIVADGIDDLFHGRIVGCHAALDREKARNEGAQLAPGQLTAGFQVVVQQIGEIALVGFVLDAFVARSGDRARSQAFVERHPPLVDREALFLPQRVFVIGRDVHQQAAITPLQQECFRRFIESGAVTACRAVRIADDVIEIAELQFRKQERQGKAQDAALGAFGHQQHRFEIQIAAEAQQFGDFFRILRVV